MAASWAEGWDDDEWRIWVATDPEGQYVVGRNAPSFASCRPHARPIAIQPMRLFGTMYEVNKCDARGDVPPREHTAQHGGNPWFTLMLMLTRTQRKQAYSCPANTEQTR